MWCYLTEIDARASSAKFESRMTIGGGERASDGGVQIAVAKLDFHFLAKSENYIRHNASKEISVLPCDIEIKFTRFNHRFQYTFMGLDMGKLREVACGK